MKWNSSKPSAALVVFVTIIYCVGAIITALLALQHHFSINFYFVDLAVVKSSQVSRRLSLKQWGRIGGKKTT